ncbi:MAG TPA: aminotransferase class V-fold PLP-dependent enzyme [Balneolales bacterium]|nr:aminotransferase class V-fold PLP-dependent enzyme [Balneolales bacterium]
MNVQPAQSLNVAEVRELFPFLKQGTCYLNHAAISPLSSKVTNAIKNRLDIRSLGSIEAFTHDKPIIDDCRVQIARLINAESEERIAFVPNTSSGLNIIANGVKWSPGDQILIGDVEFPTNVYPFLNLRRLGVDVKLITNDNGSVTAEMIEKATTPKTKLVSISTVQFLSGYRADMERIGEWCRRHDIWFVVDGIQAVGAIELDVVASHVDALCAGSHKWQMGPQGLGFLYVNKRMQDAIRPSNAGWLSVTAPWELLDYNLEFLPTAMRYELGTMNANGIVGYHAALKLLNEIGIRNIQQRILDLTSRILSEFSHWDDIRILTPNDDHHRAGIVTLDLPEMVDPDGLMENLSKENIVVAIRNGMLRLSPHFYNTEQEVDHSVSIISDLLRKKGVK